MIDFLKIPFYAINSIKQGEGWTTPDGDFYPHERLVFPAEPARTYAYFSDTSFMPQYAPFIQASTCSITKLPLAANLWRVLAKPNTLQRPKRPKWLVLLK